MKRTKRILSVILAVVLAFSASLAVLAATTDPSISQREKDNAALAREAASQGMVLLEQNDENALPIATDKPIALFGNGAMRTIRGGTGSGDPFNGGLSGGGDAMVDLSERYNINIFSVFEKEGIEVTTADFLREWAVGYDEAKIAAGSNPMQTFRYDEMELTQEIVAAAAADTDTVIYVISRNAGEGADRVNAAGDYLLNETERNNLTLMGANFDKVIVVINAGGVMDTKFFDEISGLDSLLFIGQPGQEAGYAVFDTVTGAVTPSGKLTSTWAENYSDYPASETFADNDNNNAVETYAEGIYVGYRYFDTFGIEPKYEFGYGLSYTDFNIAVQSVEADAEKVTAKVLVTNTGDTYSGKEVVQVYFSAPDSAAAEKPYQELAAYGKTDTLAPGESQLLTITYNTADMSYYNTARSSYVLDPGDYIIRIGNSSRNTHVAAVIRLDAETVTEILSNQMHAPEDLEEWSKAGRTPYTYAAEAAETAAAPVIELAGEAFPAPVNNASPYDDEKVTTYTTDPDYAPTQEYEQVLVVADKSGAKLIDVYNGDVTIEEYVAQMSLEELATINCGSGWGVANENSPIVGSNSDTIPGAAGESTNKYFDSYGLPAIVVADGPGGIRVKQDYIATNVQTGEQTTYYQYCTAWPVSIVRAQAWDLDLMKELGVAYANELAEMGITIVLGPSLNIHRDPLCGRNFEYYSEDPFISGTMAASITKGIQSVPGVGACLKHYAGNNQETNRNATNTVASERALREIYLKGFEIAVKSAQPMSIMTSYNLINGVPTADDYDLCTDIARGEWGFDGLIMTDWNGGSSTPSISMHAGNDWIMPGGTSRAENIISAMSDFPPEFAPNGQVAVQVDLMYGFINVYSARWGEFVVSADGEARETAYLGEGYTATVDGDGNILVNGEPIYTSYSGGWFNPGTWSNPLTTAVAEVSADGKEIIYRGYYPDNNTICLGDTQKCAVNNIKVIMQSIAMKAFYPDDNIVLEPYADKFELATYLTVTKEAVKEIIPVSIPEAVTAYEDFTIRLATSDRSITGFKILNEKGGKISIKTVERIESEDNYIFWDLTFNIGTAGERVISIVPLVGTSECLPLTAAITVNPMANANEIISAKASKAAVMVNKPFHVTVNAGNKVDSIRIENESGRKLGKTLTSKTRLADGTNEWIYETSIATAGTNRTMTVSSPSATNTATVSITVVK